jgi:iron complex outermembrane receptor protein
VDYFHKNTRDLLAEIPVAAGTNFTNILLTNIGTLRTRGLELGLNVTPISKRNFTLDLSYNLTYIFQNEITRLQLVNDPNYAGAEVGSIGLNGFVQIHSVGYRPSTFYLYRQIYDATGKPIEGLYEDANGDGKIDSKDKYRIKNPDPRMFMGFSANATYKKFGAGFVMRAHFDNYVFNNIKAGSAIWQNVSSGALYLNNAHVDILNSRFNSRQTWTDYYLENGSFLRMDNAYVNYNVGKIFQNKANLKVSLNCQNVFVVTKYSGLDPEINGGIDGSLYPRPRIIALGLNLDF